MEVMVAKSDYPVYINGEIVSADEAKISVFDRGFMRGDGLFETMRTYNGRLFKLHQHMERLDHGLELLRFPVRSGDLGLEPAAEQVVRASGIESARVRVEITRGVGSTGFTTHVDTPPTVVITVHPITEPQCEPLAVIISKTIRRDERSPLSSVKTINYVPSIMARMEAEDEGAEDAILLNYAGKVAEGCASNIFLWHDGRLITPDLDSGVLPGIIRQTVIEIAHDLQIPLEERPVEPEELFSAEEVFMTSSTREVAPVSTIDGRRVGTGSHEMAAMIEKEYLKRAEG
jgi:branched-chain amino acid aminotransferase